jgi:hypothetical protein
VFGALYLRKSLHSGGCVSTDDPAPSAMKKLFGRRVCVLLMLISAGGCRQGAEQASPGFSLEHSVKRPNEAVLKRATKLRADVFNQLNSPGAKPLCKSTEIDLSDDLRKLLLTGNQGQILAADWKKDPANDIERNTVVLQVSRAPPLEPVIFSFATWHKDSACTLLRIGFLIPH